MLGWVLLFLLLILIEAFIGDFTSLTISVGALAGIAAALLHLPFALQIISFSIISFAALISLRPLLKKKLSPVVQHFTADAYIGHQAEVMEKIQPDKKGRIKIGGEIWFAEATVDIGAGETVIIAEIDSAVMRVVPERDIIKLAKPVAEKENQIKNKKLNQETDIKKEEI